MVFVDVVRALYSYQAQGNDELDFQEDDILCILGAEEDIEDGWLKACRLNAQDQVGLIPSNYVATADPISKVKAIYSYQAEEETELSFAEGDWLECVAKLEDDWWLARRRGAYGLVPSNYFEECAQASKKDSTMDIFSAILNAPETSLNEDPIAEYQAQMDNEMEGGRWIDRVFVKESWNATLLEDSKKKRKGELILGGDGILGFVTGKQRTEIFKCRLRDVISYDRKTKVLTIKNCLIKYVLDVAKDVASELQEAIHQAAWEMEAEAEAAEAEEIAPELPERTRPSLQQSPRQSPMLQRVMSPIIQKQKSPPASSLLGPYVVALYDYEPREEDELKMEEDEKLLLIDDTEDDWWLVQRLHGSKRKGLAPSTYLQRVEGYSPRERDPLEEVFERASEASRSPKPATCSPKSPTGSISPVMRASFLEELKKKTKAREAPATPELESLPVDEDTGGIVDSASQRSIQESLVESLSIASLTKSPEMLHRPPIQTPKDVADAPSPALSRRLSIAVPRHVDVDEEPQKPLGSTTLPTRTFDPAGQQQAEPVKATVYKARQTSGPIEDVVLKPVPTKASEPSKAPASPTLSLGSNALSQMLLKKQHDIRANDVRIPSPTKSEALSVASGVVVKPNPWKSLSMKNIAEKKKETFSSAPAANKTLPTRPVQASSIDKPKPAETRLWTSRNGQFQVEAKYLGYKDGRVQLHKLNGNKIAVPIEQLSQRDREFAHRQEGIPWDHGPKGDFTVNGFDWLAFFAGAGVDNYRARRFAQSCMDMRLSGQVVVDGRLSRELLLGLGLTEADVAEVLRSATLGKQLRAEEEAIRKNLEKIKLAKAQMAVRTSAPPQSQATRRPSDEFAALDPLRPPTMLTPTASQRSAPSTTDQTRSIRGSILEPERRHGNTVLTSTTITSVGGNGFIPPNPLAAYLQPHSQSMQPHPAQRQQAGSVPTQYAQESYRSPGHQQPPTGFQFQAPQQPPLLPTQFSSQAAPRPAYLSNTTGALPSMGQQQQRIHAMQQGPNGGIAGAAPVLNLAGYPIIGTTQQRTEYYGYSPSTQQQQQAPSAQQMPMQQFVPYQMPTAAMQQPAYFSTPIPLQTQGLEPYRPQQPPQQQQQNGSDKYSIFKYVDPNAPQVLSQPPTLQTKPYSHRSDLNPS